MKIFTFLGVLCSTLLVVHTAKAQDGWPKTTTTSAGAVVKMYQWQPESYSGNNLQARAAISVLESGKTDPSFGVAWFKATTINNGQQVQVPSIYITDIKLPEEADNNKLEEIAVAIEKQIPSWNVSFAASDLQSSIDINNKQTQLAGQINTTAPKIIYSNKPSILVLIDGAPKLQYNNDWGVEAVVNTPFAIVKNNDGRYYLYGGKHWYTATSVTGNYSLTTNVPNNLSKIAQAVNEANKDNDAQESDPGTIYTIITSTEPAELVQTRGEASFANVQGTGLLYVSNTDNDIFMDVNSQQYYVLLSGRWYTSKTLSGQWQYTGADKLPADFAKIPEGSPKDNVLASVAGTDQAQDALLDAQVPQTAKVDRNNTKADIIYDGDPEFEVIDGTEMYYAVNTPASVIRWRGRYYAVDNGVWFEAYSAMGPWSVAVARPHVVALIPPRYPVYYMKYVYIYDVYPDYVYMGYTPGYLNAYIYGPTVVYGTGYYYRPWYGRYYYPRPCTWGYGVRYNPWYGWGINIGFSSGWFHVNVGFGNYHPRSYWGYGGWWGPSVYRPPYCYTPYRTRGYYGGGWYGPYSANRGGRNVNINITNINYNNNIYRARRDVVTRDINRYNNNNRNGGRQIMANNNNRFNRSNNNFRGPVDRQNATPNDRFRNNNNNRINRNNNGAVSGNNTINRNPGSNGNGNSTFRRNRTLTDANNSNNNRAWNNQNGNSNNRRPGTITPRQQNTQQPSQNATPNNRFRNNNGQRNSDGSPARIATPQNRERTIRDNNNRSSSPNRFENRGNTNRSSNQPDVIRRAPQRTVQPQNREPARRITERPNTNRQQHTSRPQITQRAPRTAPATQRAPAQRQAPAQRPAVRSNDRGSSGGSARPARVSSSQKSSGDKGRSGRKRGE